ncbi:Non-histone chromosomal protein 6 [Dacryopinax primogenitus]|uniref:Non-histone chromosomal protein 6 n=1 Tax=Dacryopinax primogenitus (strain DJM 731) TaxID=1858805 RepID=M5FS90_DACPD|nr:Non-histone chromosomal protein 6 [Dacryopinax primogenitus]EJU00226.1 Non-histone chromosomal protein 6 [Dacryopinax primogenitus]
MPKVKSADAAPHRKRGSKKDKDAPKRGLSAYLIFSNEWRDRVKAENPDASFGDVGRLLGAKWKELPDEEKKEYQRKSDEDKQRAAKEKAEYEGKKSA